jgi:hypothetical protein
MLDDCFPGQFLQQAVEPFFFLIAEPRPLQSVGNGQANRTATVDHGVIAVGDQDRQRRFAVAGGVAEQVFLRLEPRCLARDDLLAQSNHGLGNRYLVENRFAQFLIQFSDVLVHALEIGFVPFPQFRAGDRVVIHCFGARGGWLVNIPTELNGLDHDADVLVVFQGQLGKVLDAGIGKEDWRQRQHIHLAGLQRFLGRVLVVGNVPVPNDL